MPEGFGISPNQIAQIMALFGGGGPQVPAFQNSGMSWYGNQPISYSGRPGGQNMQGLGGLLGQYGGLGMLASAGLQSLGVGQGYQLGNFGSTYSYTDHAAQSRYDAGLQAAQSVGSVGINDQVQAYVAAINNARFGAGTDTSTDRTRKFMANYQAMKETPVLSQAVSGVEELLLPGGSQTAFIQRAYDAMRMNNLGQPGGVDGKALGEFANYFRNERVLDGKNNENFGFTRGFSMGDFGTMSEALGRIGQLEIPGGSEQDIEQKMQKAGDQLGKLAAVLDSVRELTGQQDAPVSQLLSSLDQLTAGGLSSGLDLQKMEKMIYTAKALGRSANLSDGQVANLMQQSSAMAAGLGFSPQEGANIFASGVANIQGMFAITRGNRMVQNMTYEDVVKSSMAQATEFAGSMSARKLGALMAMRDRRGEAFGGELGGLIERVREGTATDAEQAQLIESLRQPNIGGTLQELGINRTAFSAAQGSRTVMAEMQSKYDIASMGRVASGRDSLRMAMGNNRTGYNAIMRGMTGTAGSDLEYGDVETILGSVQEEGVKSQDDAMARMRQRLAERIRARNPDATEEDIDQAMAAFRPLAMDAYGAVAASRGLERTKGLGVVMGDGAEAAKQARRMSVRAARDADLDIKIKEWGVGAQGGGARSVLSGLVGSMYQESNRLADIDANEAELSELRSQLADASPEEKAKIENRIAELMKAREGMGEGGVQWNALLAGASGGFKPGDVKERISKLISGDKKELMSVTTELADIQRQREGGNLTDEEAKRLEKRANELREKQNEIMTKLADTLGKLDLGEGRDAAASRRNSLIRKMASLDGASSADVLDMFEELRSEDLTSLGKSFTETYGKAEAMYQLGARQKIKDRALKLEREYAQAVKSGDKDALASVKEKLRELLSDAEDLDFRLQDDNKRAAIMANRAAGGDRVVDSVTADGKVTYMPTPKQSRDEKTSKEQATAGGEQHLSMEVKHPSGYVTETTAKVKKAARDGLNWLMGGGW